MRFHRRLLLQAAIASCAFPASAQRTTPPWVAERLRTFEAIERLRSNGDLKAYFEQRLIWSNYTGSLLAGEFSTDGRPQWSPELERVLGSQDLAASRAFKMAAESALALYQFVAVPEPLGLAIRHAGQTQNSDYLADLQQLGADWALLEYRLGYLPGRENAAASQLELSISTYGRTQNRAGATRAAAKLADMYVRRTSGIKRHDFMRARDLAERYSESDSGQHADARISLYCAWSMAALGLTSLGAPVGFREEASKAAKAAATLANSRGSSASRVRAQMTLGICESQLGRVQAALSAFEAAVALSKRLDRGLEPELFADAQGQMGLLLLAQSQNDRRTGSVKALPYLQSAAAELNFVDSSVSFETARVFHSPSIDYIAGLGNAHCALSNWEDALRAYDRARSQIYSYLGARFEESFSIERSRQSRSVGLNNAYALVQYGAPQRALFRIDSSRGFLSRIAKGLGEILRSASAPQANADFQEFQKKGAIEQINALRQIPSLEAQLLQPNSDVRVIEWNLGELRRTTQTIMGAPSDDNAESFFLSSDAPRTRESIEAQKASGLPMPNEMPYPDYLAAHRDYQATYAPDTEALAVAQRRRLITILTSDVGQGILSTTPTGTSWHPVAGASTTVVEPQWESAALSNDMAIALTTTVNSLGLMPGETLSISPDVTLGQVPIGMIKDTQTGRMLIEDFPIALCPSVSALRSADKAARATPTGRLRFGAVQNPGGDPLLASAKIEVALAGKHFPKNSVLAINSDTAVESLALLEAFSGREYWHFASHAGFVSGSPLDSYVQIGANLRLTLRDLLFRAQDIVSPKLVFLSACESAVVESGSLSEEFLGLAPTFLSMGAQGIVGSLWRVSDISAGLFASYFYKSHLSEGKTPAEAVRSAQLWLRSANTSDLIDFITNESVGTDLSEDDLASAIAALSDQNAETPFASPYHWAAWAYYGG